MIFRLFLRVFLYQFYLRLQFWTREILVRNISTIPVTTFVQDLISLCINYLLVLHLCTVCYISLDKKTLAEVKQTDKQLWSTQIFT